MKTEIEINDYLSEKEKKDIAIEVFKDGIKQTLFKGYTGLVTSAECERIIGNIAYNTIYPMVDKYIPGFESLIRDKVLQMINSDSIKHSVLRRSNTWGDKDSIAMTIVDKCINENKSLIESKVLEAINNLSCDDKIAAKASDIFEKFAEKFLDLSTLIIDRKK